MVTSTKKLKDFNGATMHAGMPRETNFPVRKMISITPEMAKEIEDYRWEHRVTSESELIRMLIELGLKAAKAKDAPARKTK